MGSESQKKEGVSRTLEARAEMRGRLAFGWDRVEWGSEGVG